MKSCIWLIIIQLSIFYLRKLRYSSTKNQSLCFIEDVDKKQLNVNYKTMSGPKNWEEAKERELSLGVARADPGSLQWKWLEDTHEVTEEARSSLWEEHFRASILGSKNSKESLETETGLVFAG